MFSSWKGHRLLKKESIQVLNVFPSLRDEKRIYKHLASSLDIPLYGRGVNNRIWLPVVLEYNWTSRYFC